MRLPLAVLVLAAAAAAQNPIPPLPPVPVPPENPITAAKTILGKLLFWEEQLSSNNRVACGSCHTFAAGGGDLRRLVHPGPDGVTPSPDDKQGSPGVIRSGANNAYLPDPVFGLAVQATTRTAPSMLAAAWFPELFWDGRAGTSFVDPETNAVAVQNGGALENQALAPILSGVESSHDARQWTEVEHKLETARPMALATNLPPDMAAAIQGGATYPDLFAAAFGTPDITARRIAFALATYQRSLRADQTPWDRFNAGQANAMTQQQINGWNLFRGPARCNLCHVPPLFSDGLFHNLGLRPVAEDNGRQGVTNNFADRGRFKTPSLRGAGLRPSFMHDGRFTQLIGPPGTPNVFGFYVGGGGPFPDNKDPLLQPIGGAVPPQAANDLMAFVGQALVDPRVAAGTFPFDRPTLRSDVMPPQGFAYGVGTGGTGGRVPSLLAEVPANLGNVDFKVGIANARGAALAVLALALLPGTGTTVGANLNVDLGTASVFYVPLAGSPGAAGAGYGTVLFPLPRVPALVGVTGYAQGFVFDAGAAQGLAGTRGAEIRLF